MKINQMLLPLETKNKGNQTEEASNARGAKEKKWYTDLRLKLLNKKPKVLLQLLKTMMMRVMHLQLKMFAEIDERSKSWTMMVKKGKLHQKE